MIGSTNGIRVELFSMYSDDEWGVNMSIKEVAMQSAGLPRARDFTGPNVQAIGVLAM